jgi:surfeit locus 1 family protein
VIAGYRFQFRPGVTIAAAFVLAALIALGTWQLQRLHWKQDLIARVEARVSAEPIPFDEAVRRAEAGENMEYAPVAITGRIDPARAADVFGTYDGEAGVYTFVPLSSADEKVYVNEGFTPQDMAATTPPPAEAEEKVTGLFRYAEEPAPPASWFRPAGKSVDGLWFVRDPQAFAAEAGSVSPPFYIDRFAVEGRDWPKGGTTRLEFSNRHLEYALTWYGLAGALIAVWLAFSLKKPD